MPPRRFYQSGQRAGDRVALTFDDGPNPPRTDEVLGVLRQADVRATFFVFGKWAERYPDTVRRLLDEGHLVGNHGYAGRRRAGEYDDGEAVIRRITGLPCRYLRAHQFDYETYFRSSVALLPDRFAIDADVRPMDWLADDPESIAWRVLDDFELGPGSIIVLHDGAEMEDEAPRLARPVPMVQALPRIIEGITAQGLRCVRLDELELADPIEWTPAASPRVSAFAPTGSTVRESAG